MLIILKLLIVNKKSPAKAGPKFLYFLFNYILALLLFSVKIKVETKICS